ncbi:dihydroneopterin aldolase [Paenibacillus aquistagni]|uniref:7,8-dihydroneopterin aldolase n=1 Tax=Paenibacillus aquistagni TaxID=1852522 RepID=A0A1X7LYV2_9BACL|nr:dihydroneopterin aldolase [Paenibacillus aquistagni]
MSHLHQGIAPYPKTKIVGLDRMKLKRMSFYGKHGVFEEERVLGQSWYVDLDLQIDMQAAGLDDNLEQSINYAELHAAVKQIVEQESYQLVETLTERIASMLLHQFSRINEATVRVTKPNPPFDIHFDGVTIEMTRARMIEGEESE